MARWYETESCRHGESGVVHSVREHGRREAPRTGLGGDRSSRTRVHLTPRGSRNFEPTDRRAPVDR